MKVTHIAGVTFCNRYEDGGEDRQALLQEIKEPQIVMLEKCLYHNPETNEDEDALKIRSSATNKVLGFVPRTEIQQLWNIERMRLSVIEYKGVYCGELYHTEAPTPRQYKLVKSYQKSGIIDEMPPYDKNIFSWTIDKVKDKLKQQQKSKGMS